MAVPIPITSGIYTDGNSRVRVSYPVNMQLVPGENGVSDGTLEPTEGIAAFATGQGPDRGGIVWIKDGVHYRVSGQKLISVAADGSTAVLGDVPGTDEARLTYSTDKLAIFANGQLRYWDGLTLTLVTDPDLGTVTDGVFVDNYFLFTDGRFLGVTELGDPTAVDALKNGSSEADPDPIQCVLKVDNEVHAVNRHTIEVFENIGGDNFPFQRRENALISKGAIGRSAACVFQGAVAFIGGGQNEGKSEAPRVYLGKNAQTIPISTREVDQLLEQSYTEAQLGSAVLEAVTTRGSELLFVHLPDRTLVYDATASEAETPERSERRVWHFRTGPGAGFTQYRARHIVRAHDAWIVGDPQSSAIGRWTLDDSKDRGVDVRWEISTLMLRNKGNGAQINELKLVALTGGAPFGEDAMIATSYSLDGRTFTQDRPIHSGKRGDTAKELLWIGQGFWKNFRVQRITGDSGSRLTALRLEAEITPLKY